MDTSSRPTYMYKVRIFLIADGKLSLNLDVIIVKAIKLKIPLLVFLRQKLRSLISDGFEFLCLKGHLISTRQSRQQLMPSGVAPRKGC